MEEYTLKKMYKSPNGTIRAILDGTVFRAPIVVKGIEPCVKNWKKPITIARHAYGDVYKNTEMYIDGPGDAYLVFEGADGQQRKELIHHYEGPGVLQGMHNLDDSITSFARCCFNYALIQNRICGLVARIRSPRFMTDVLRKSLQLFMKMSLRRNSRQQALNISTA